MKKKNRNAGNNHVDRTGQTIRVGSSMRSSGGETVVSRMTINSEDFVGGKFDDPYDDEGPDHSNLAMLQTGNIGFENRIDNSKKNDRYSRKGRRKGRFILCAGCNTPTHKISTFRGKMIPLTHGHRVQNGRCYACNPTSNSRFHPQLDRKNSMTSRGSSGSRGSSDDANNCILQPPHIKNSMSSRDLSDHIKNSMSSRDLSDHILQPLPEDNDSPSNQEKDKGYINEDNNRSKHGNVINSEQPISIERKVNVVSLSADNSTIGSNSSSETMLKSVDDASRNRILNVLGTLDDLLDIRDLMAANKEDSLVMTEACARLQFLASDDNCMPGAAQVGLVSEVVEAMDLHLKEERLQEKGCAALYYFAVSGAENKNAIMHADGILTVITAMSHFEKNGSIQEWACQCLASFSEGNSQNKMSTGVYGGIERIIKAMKANEEWTFVQSYGMKALWSLTVGSHENAIQVFDADGVNVIVKAFTQINNVDVKTLAEYYGVGALFSMASTNEVQILKSMAKAGMTEVFIRLIREHRNYMDVVEKSVATLIQMFAIFSSEAFNFVDNGGIPVIIGAMKEFHNKYSIQHGGCTIFKILLKLSSMHGKIIVENNGIDAIYSAIESFGCLQDEFESTATLLLGFL